MRDHSQLHWEIRWMVVCESRVFELYLTPILTLQ